MLLLSLLVARKKKLPKLLNLLLPKLLLLLLIRLPLLLLTALPLIQLLLQLLPLLTNSSRSLVSKETGQNKARLQPVGLFRFYTFAACRLSLWFSPISLLYRCFRP